MVQVHLSFESQFYISFGDQCPLEKLVRLMILVNHPSIQNSAHTIVYLLFRLFMDIVPMSPQWTLWRTLWHTLWHSGLEERPVWSSKLLLVSKNETSFLLTNQQKYRTLLSLKSDKIAAIELCEISSFPWCTLTFSISSYSGRAVRSFLNLPFPEIHYVPPDQLLTHF